MAFEELKARQSVMWGNGPFDRIAASIEDCTSRSRRRLRRARASVRSTSAAARGASRS